MKFHYYSWSWFKEASRPWKLNPDIYYCHEIFIKPSSFLSLPFPLYIVTVTNLKNANGRQGNDNGEMKIDFSFFKHCNVNMNGKLMNGSEWTFEQHGKDSRTVHDEWLKRKDLL